MVDSKSCGCGETSCNCTGQKGLGGVRRMTPIEAPRIYGDRRPVIGEVVTIINASFSSSGIDLVDAWSRAVSRGDVHEIMVWNSLEEGENDAAAVAFIEVTQGGNVVNGDEIRVDGESVGRLIGFDYNHMPNHMNIVVETGALRLPLRLGSLVEFASGPTAPIADGDCC